MAVAGGRMLKVCSITDYVAECIWFDHVGRIHTGSFEVSALESVWGPPRTLWPQVNNRVPEWLADELEKKAREKRRAKHRKPKASLRIKRAPKSGDPQRNFGCN